MKLKNKKTGEILSGLGSFIIQNPNHINCEAITKYDSLSELNEEWEDYEEPKEYWFVNANGEVNSFNSDYEDEAETIATMEIGNYFETKEEAELAVRKLKAWKRLKDNGFMIAGWDYEGFGMKVEAGRISFEINKDCNEDKDLDICFGGEG